MPNTDPSYIGTFGFRSSRDTDKYADYGYEVVAGTPYVKAASRGASCSGRGFVDCGTHMLVIGRLIDTVKGQGKPMTYATTTA